jgi:hypothetical protein
VYFDYCLSFKHATDVLSSSAARALGAVINKHKAVGGFGFSLYTKLFNNLVVPIIDYGSGVWATKSSFQSQIIQNKAIRAFLGVHKFTPNLAIQGDMGWDSSSLRQKLNVLRLWCRLIMMPASRLTKRIFLWDYELSMSGYNNWSNFVKTLFYETGYPLMYDNIFSPIDVSSLVDSCRNSLRTIETDCWRSDLEKFPKLRTYKCFKNTFGTEKYIQIPLSPSLRSILAQFRTGVLPLRIETGRFTSPYTHLESRICEICNREIEDEKHFLFRCPFYNIDRMKLFKDLNMNMTCDDTNYDVILKFIFNDSNSLRKTAQFIESSFAKRCAYISSV